MQSQYSRVVRNFLLYVATLFVAVFGYISFLSPLVSAQSASWSGSNVTYEDKVFLRQDGDQIADRIGANNGSLIFQHPNQPAVGEQIEFIYFTDGESANTSDSAQYVSFTLGNNGSLDNRQGPTSIQVDARADSPEEAAAQEETSSCEIEGIGWIICPITTFLARGTDWLFNVLTVLMEVPPVLTDTDAPLFRIWNTMLFIANLAFVIAFLIIIYSQITSYGVSNYGIKRMLPRLIIAAVLVNISYYVCAIAVDISNILGYSLQGMFIDIRNSAVGEAGNGWQTVKWEDVAVFVLSGGTAAAAGVLAGTMAFATYGVGAIFLILPALLGVILAVLVAILILAARQAIITVLIILSPLAFVAYLLPNTESWFDRWRGTFMTMLMLFPIFSILFGGAQLAGTAIIHNAMSTGSLTVMILGMVTQVAPIVITPFLIKFSGSLLGRIAGMVNNPNRGLIDRARNFSKDQAEHHKHQRLGGVMQNEPKKHQVMRRTARGLEMRRRKREGQRNYWQAQEEDGWVKSDAYQDLQVKTGRTQHSVDTTKSTVDNTVKSDIQNEINIKGSRLHLENVELEASKATLENANTKTAVMMEEYKTLAATDTSETRAGRAIRAIQSTNEEIAFKAIAKQRAIDQQGKELAELMSIRDDDTDNPRYDRSQHALNVAAGIDPMGRIRAQGDAVSKIARLSQEARSNVLNLMEDKAIQEGMTLKDYTSNITSQATKVGLDQSGYNRQEVEAAFEQKAREGDIRTFEKARGSQLIDQSMISEIIGRNAGVFKEKGGFHLQADYGLARKENESYDSWNNRMKMAAISSMADTAPQDISKLKASWLEHVDSDILSPQNITKLRSDVKATMPAPVAAKFESHLQATFDNLAIAMNNPDTLASLDTRKIEINNIINNMQKQGFETSNVAKKIIRDQNGGDFKEPEPIKPMSDLNQAPPSGPAAEGED